MVAAGELGELRLVQVEYPQDWLATEVESEGQKQAVWRTDPARAGAGGCIGDIGTHAFHLAEFISGLQVTDLLADLSCFGQGRELDDNAQVLLRFSNGARGSLWSSQVAIGHENGLRVRLYGDKAALEWFQEDPNELKFTRLGQPPQRLTRGSAAIGATANAATRLPSGHPEGFLEGFGNLYNDLADQITAARQGQGSSGLSLVPTIEDGLRGMKFIDRVVSSSKHGSRWETLD
jgi:predicted dehydrogenase